MNAFSPSFASANKNLNLTLSLSTSLAVSRKPLATKPAPKPNKALRKLKTESLTLFIPLVADCIACLVLSLAIISILTCLVAIYRFALSNRSCFCLSSF